MTLVRHRLLTPEGLPLPGQKVTVLLMLREDLSDDSYALNVPVNASFTGGVIRRRVVSTSDADGWLEWELPPNEYIVPAGTYYQLQGLGRNRTILSVFDSAIPVDLSECQLDLVDFNASNLVIVRGPRGKNALAGPDLVDAAATVAQQTAQQTAQAVLATKVDVNTYTAGLKAKADVTALGSKVDGDTFTAALGGKQDKTTIAADLASQVSNGSALAVALRAAFRPSGDVLLDGITEWWCRPVAVYLNTPYPRTLFGAIGKNNGSNQAPILACEFNHATGTVLRVPVGLADVDDHNAPAIWAKDGHRPVILWQNHSQEQFFHIKVGALNGDLRTLASAPDQTVTAAGGVSYTQLFHIPSLSDATQDTFYVFTRVQLTGDIGWNVEQISVNQSTGAVTKLGNVRLWSAGGNLAYCTVAEANASSGQQLRLAFGYNPAAASAEVHQVYLFDLDVVTGAITNPFDPVMSANLNTGVGLPLVDTAQTPAIANTPTGTSRRLFYTRPGPGRRAIAYAEGLTSDPDNWTYKLFRQDTDSGTIDGLRVGANAWASAGYTAAMNVAGGFEFRTRVQFDATPTATIELGRRYGTTAPRSWYFRMTTGRILQFTAIRSDTGAATSVYASPSAVPGNWTDDMAFGFRIDFTSGHGVVQFTYSTDGGTTWTNLGAAVDVSGTNYTIQDSTYPLEVPSPTSTLRVTSSLRRATLLTLGGTVVADANFATAWPAGASTYTDPAGVVWTLQGTAAAVTRSAATWVTDTFGSAGPRIGYNLGSNYIGGMTFPDPCPEAMFYAAYMDKATGISKVTEWRLQRQLNGTSAWLSTDIATTAAGQPRLARPVPPLNGGPNRALVNEIVAYNLVDFRAYEANIRAIP